MTRSNSTFLRLVALFVLVLTNAALLAQPANPDAPAVRDANGIVEIVPTSRQQPAIWRYTTDKPADNWAAAAFDDSAWREGPGGFGRAGTPGARFRTQWDTQDIWLRRSITLPADGVDPTTLQLLVFHDEDVEIYIDGILAGREGGHVTEYLPIELQPEAKALIKPGAKLMLAVHCRQRSGGQGIDVGLANMPAGLDAASIRRKNRYRGFAMSRPGNAANGAKLFASDLLACSRCHSADGKGQHPGPDLSTIGDKFPRAELVNAILNPSATVAVGYSTTVIATKSGNVVTGVLKDVTAEEVGIMGADGAMQRIENADIRVRRTAEGSMMPDGLEAGVSQEEFTDLVEYLVSLRAADISGAGRQGMPANIPELRAPVQLEAVHHDEHRFDHPSWFGQIPGESGTFLVCEHETGRIWRLAGSSDGQTKTLWGDFGREVRRGAATGLLGLAFHPKFRENRKYYIQHELMDRGRLVARVSEKTASTDFQRDSGQPSRTIIEFPCSTDVHTGGGIEFGPDGFLYIGMGDTGPQGDPQGHGQDLRSPLGKMLRIDVDHEDAGRLYAIPADNPFLSQPEARPEIWAYGFREPWRFTFDSKTGDLWVGDVGQDRIEEVAIVRKGENHGWNVYEGFDLFSTRYRTDRAPHVPPVFAYNRRLGNSITGGYVYRTASESPFNGLYLCGDFTSKRIWALQQTDRKLTQIWQLCIAPQSIASFSRDEAGTIYLVGYEGTIYRMNLSDAKLEPKPE